MYEIIVLFMCVVTFIGALDTYFYVRSSRRTKEEFIKLLKEMIENDKY